jgi:hypothetical protein
MPFAGCFKHVASLSGSIDWAGVLTLSPLGLRLSIFVTMHTGREGAGRGAFHILPDDSSPYLAKGICIGPVSSLLLHHANNVR